MASKDEIETAPDPEEDDLDDLDDVLDEFEAKPSLPTEPKPAAATSPASKTAEPSGPADPANAPSSTHRNSRRWHRNSRRRRPLHPPPSRHEQPDLRTRLQPRNAAAIRRNDGRTPRSGRGAYHRPSGRACQAGQREYACFAQRRSDERRCWE